MTYVLTVVTRSWRVVTAVLIAIAGCYAIVGALYALPLRLTQDVGTAAPLVGGVYAPEHANSFSFAYSQGTTTVHLPEFGAGTLLVQLRLAGPGATTAVAVRVASAAGSVDVGAVRGLRVYHLLTRAGGDEPLRIESATTQISGDSRQLGVLIDSVAITTVGVMRPGPALLLALALVIVCAWVLVGTLGTRWRTRAMLLALAVLALCVAVALTHGRVTIPWVWIAVGAVYSLLLLALLRLEQVRLLRTAAGVGILFTGWRIALWLFGWLIIAQTDTITPVVAAISHYNRHSRHDGSLWGVLVGSWTRLDAFNFLYIAEKGYYGPNEYYYTAFFPLYPALIWLVTPLTLGLPRIAAPLIANACFLGALLLLRRLLSDDVGEEVAFRTIIVLLLFPTSIYFAVGYSESLALLLLLWLVLAARHEQWWWAGVAGFLLALSRVPGIMATPMIGVLYLAQRHWRFRAVRADALAALLPLLGLGLYMVIQWRLFGTPIAFLKANAMFWHQEISWPWVMPLALLARSTTWQPIDMFHLAIWAVFIVLSVVVLIRLPLAYQLVLLLLVPSYLSNLIHSLPRYVLLGFPTFAVVALWLNRPWQRAVWYAGSLALLLLAIMLYIQDYWLA